MLIVEGMDNTGKTTLVETLKEKLGFKEVVKSLGAVSYRKLFIFADKYITGMEKIRLAKKPVTVYPIIHDRFPVFSDQVYGSILRNTNPFVELNEGDWLVRRLWMLAPTIIYCRPTTERIIKFDDREQMEGVKDNALVLLGRYDEVMLYWERKTGVPVFRYSYETDTVDHLLEKLSTRGWTIDG